MAGPSVLRLLDANANRALEGLRVCEDLFRFHYAHARLSGRLRRLRHALGATLGGLPVSRGDLARARDTRQDPGRQAPASPAVSLEQLVVMNFQRAKEALRVLEECCRLAAPAHSPGFQRLRFKTYDAERQCLLYLATVRHS
jgi:thiamine-phosphate pyrophosphorylase